jgi:hypothetical protein
MDKLIIRCPNCTYFYPERETNQYNNIPIAEILPNGAISIRRSRRIADGEHETVLIVGNNFELLCGQCLTPVFKIQSQTIQLGTAIITRGSFNAMIADRMIGTA